MFEDECNIKSYKTIEDRHLAKNGLITEVIVGIQKMFKMRGNDENITFNKVASMTNSSVYKTVIAGDDKCKCLDLWTIHNQKGEFIVDYYTLRKLQSK